MKLRDRLFISYSLLSLVILLFAAWIIERQVVAQARQQVQEEMKVTLPLYDAVWEEQAKRLSALGMAMAGSQIVKTIFGDPRASRDSETIRQMLAEFGDELSENVDLVLICDGGGHITFAGPAVTGLSDLPSARLVAERQKPAQYFELLGGRLFHTALTPVISHSSSESFDNTLAVLVTASELNGRMARELRMRAHSDVIFFAGDKPYASSLDPRLEALAAGAVVAKEIGRDAPDQPAELTVAGENQLVFARPLTGSDGQRTGYVVVLHSLAEAGRLFRAISNRLIFVGTISLVLALFVSFFMARRVTRPIESLVVGASEWGKGNYDYSIASKHDGEIGQLASAFEQMRQSIKQGQASLLRNERLATVGKMASGIIHDLRTPLAAISTAADLFSGADLSTAQRKLLAESQVRASQRMATMLKELLEFSMGKYQLRLERHSLAALLASVARETVTAEGAPNVSVEAHIPVNLFVRVDAEHTRRLFENLLVNSVQAMPEGGKVTMRAAADLGRVRINITDTGAGIPAQFRDRLFEPFVSHGKQGGTGLGLAIARSIAEAHGGSLSLVSAENQPADFCVELPLDQGAEDGG